jgi:hypothetical protein
MLRPAGVAALVVLGSLLLAGPALAQPQQGNLLPNPRLFSVTPPGGKAGSSVEVTFAGQDLEEPQALLFSHPGIKAVPVTPPPPPPPDPKKPPTKPMAPPAVTKFNVSIAPDVPPGIHDVRLVNKWGVSNPRAFVVGDLVEVAEKEPNNDVNQAHRVELNTTVNGVISPGTDVDYFVFAGKKGQRVVVSCLASSIDSRLDPELRIFDSANRPLGYSHRYRDGDALADCILPADGDCYVRLCHFTYIAAGAANEFYYRLTISTAPWIDAVHPPMVEPGKPAQLTVYGRNLPGGKPDPTAVVAGKVLEKLTVTVTAPTDPAVLQRLGFTGHVAPNASGLDGFEYRLRNEAGASNPYLITFARAPVVLDNEANDTPETAQEITLPCEVAGRIEKKRDRDWYAFSAKKGDVYTIEVVSERLGSPAYMYFVLRNPANKQDLFRTPDDNAETLSPNKFVTRTSDPAPFRFVVPADGKYQLLVASQVGDTLADPRHLYRLRITPEQPDFRLVLVPPATNRPDAVTVRPGGDTYCSVYVWRQDGFKGDVTLTAEGLPPGVTCPPQTIACPPKTAVANLPPAMLVFSAAADAAPWAGEVKVKGTALINGQTVVREARAGSVTWPVQPQQNIPTISRLDRSLMLAVRDKAPFKLAPGVAQLTVIQGEKATVPLKLTRIAPDFKGAVQVQPTQPQEQIPGLQMPPVNIAATDGSLVLTAGTNMYPGTYNIVLRAQAQVPFNKDPMAKSRPNINVVLPSAPISLTVLPKQVGTLSVSNANPTVKAGTQAELVVKVNRMFDYAGEFKVQLVLPPNVQGVGADEVTIPAGKDEAKLVVKVPADAAPGNRPNLVVKLTATLAGKTLAQESKINVNVVK